MDCPERLLKILHFQIHLFSKNIRDLQTCPHFRKTFKFHCHHVNLQVLLWQFYLLLLYSFIILQAWLQPFIAIGHEQPGGGACLLCHHPKGGVATAASHFRPTTHSHTAAAGCHGHKHTECRVPGKAYLHNPHIFKLTLSMV